MKVPLSSLKGTFALLTLLIGSVALFAGSSAYRSTPNTTTVGAGAFEASLIGREMRSSSFNPFVASVTTDKADYVPGEIVYITGTGFGPNDVVTLQVTDIGPAGFADASGYGTWTKTADSSGNFSTSWLVGTESLNRQLRLTADGAPSGFHAETTFTDASIGTYDQCSNDDGDGYATGDTGCRWINGNLQSNNSTYMEGDATVQRAWLTGFVPGSSHTITFQYGTTKQGTHAYDYLTRWDWSENWVTVPDRCQDITGCTTATEVASNIPDDPNVPAAIQTAGPGSRQFVMRGGTFAAVNPVSVPDGDITEYPGDSETLITVSFTVGPSSGSMCETRQGVTTCGVAIWFGAHIARTDQWFAFNGTTGAGDIEGSPYHVALYRIDGESVGQRDNQMQANTIVIPDGTITIIKDAVPNDAQDFAYTTTGTGLSNFSLDDDADPTLSNTKLFSNVAPGTYTVTETPVAGWALTNLVCVDGNGGTTVNVVTGVATIDMSAGEDITCTYTNTLQTASIQIIKDTVPDGPTDFAFTTTGTGPAAFTAGFSLDDDADGTLPNNRTFTFTGAAATGTKTVTEPAVAGFTLTGLNCTGGGGNTSTASNVATIGLDPGETVVCTYTNTQDATIQIIKDTVPNGPTDFAFTTTGTGPAAFTAGFSLDDDADGTLPNNRTFTFSGAQATGTKTVTEPAVAGFTLTGLNCTGGGGNTSTASNVATIGLDPGETVVCTYTNTQDATIQIIKDAVPNDAQDFAFTTTGTGPAAFTAGFSLDDDADGTLPNNRTFTFSGAQATGTKTVTETAVAGWDLTGLSCTGGGGNTSTAGNVATIGLDPGETVVCTFTNTKRGHIVVDKVTVPSLDPQSFNFTAGGTGYNNFSLTDAATPNDQEVVPGAYSVAESVPSGWDLTSATCDQGETPASLDVGPGETVTCTFTNTKRGTVTLVKTEQGQAPTRAYTFQIREGATANEEGNILATGTAAIGQTTAVVFDCDSGVSTAECEDIPGPVGIAHFPPGSYQLCEIGLLPGWTHTLGSLGTVFVPNSDIPIPDNTIECVNITIVAGAEFDAGIIDNRPPGDARTIGFWKNWTSCDGNGNQRPVLDYVLYNYPGPVDPADTPEEPNGTDMPGWPGPATPGILLGNLVIDTCQEAVSILDKRSISGGTGRGDKLAKDPAFNMAAQLLAAKLNLAAGAGAPTCLAAIIAEADAKLALVNFNGVNVPSYPGSPSEQNQLKQRINYLGGLLDDYNNNELDCGDWVPLIP